MKAVIYTRVSTDIQDNNRQINELNDYARLNNLTIVNTFEDIITGVSKGVNRTGYSDMLIYLTNNEDVKLILCWELSRFGRSMIDVYQNINYLRDKGINIYFKKEGIETLSNSATSQLQLNLLASFAEFERTTIRDRMNSGRRNAVRRGGADGGRIKAYGYDVVDKQLVINENEAEIVRLIYDLYLGKQMNSELIAIYLNNNNIPTKYQNLKKSGKIKTTMGVAGWRSGIVINILKNQLYIGKRTYSGVIIEDEKFRIIDNETFEKVQIKLAAQKRVFPNAQKFENIFKGKIFCGHCGCGISMKKGRVAGTFNHYVCGHKFKNRVTKVNCSSRMIRIDILNNVLYHMLNRYTISDEAIKERIKYNVNEVEKLRIEFQNINSELAKSETKKKKLLDIYLSELIDKSQYTEQLTQLTNLETENINRSNEISGLIGNLESENKELESKEVVNLQNPELFKKNINSLIERITITEVEDYSEFNFYPTTQRYLLRIKVQMIDVNAVFEAVVSNREQVPIVITI